jgi:AcrR family transcriptional regulator
LEEICEHADVAARTFFNHFESREHLYQAIAERRADQLALTITASADADGHATDRLRELFSHLGRYLEARPRYRELVGEMLSLRADGGNEIARDRTLGRAALGFITSGIERGEIDDQHPPEILADLMLGALTTALTNWCSSDAYELVPALSASADVLGVVFSTTSPLSGGNPAR